LFEQEKESMLGARSGADFAGHAVKKTSGWIMAFTMLDAL